MPKSSKRFVLSNERVNSLGFRVITVGINIEDFKKNPVMLWMHVRDTDSQKEAPLPIGYWDDIRVNDTVLSAVPVFDDSDEFALKIYHKVEHGTIRAASVSIDPLEFDTNKQNWVTGQTKPTVVKSTLSEASIVDIGSNADAVVLTGSNPLSLKLSKNGQTDMDRYNPVPVSDNQESSRKAEENPDEHTPATKAIFKNAVDCGKFTQAEMNRLAKLTTNDPDILSAMKGVIKSTKINPENIDGKFHHTLIKAAATKTYDEIHLYDCQLRDMKANAPELYKAKFFEKFGRLPADVA